MDRLGTSMAYALRSVAMARGEWALAAELLYREIDGAASTMESAALHLELALIYDEKLLDANQARVNYEQALALDPDIPAAPAPLARLYELAGRHEDAARMVTSEPSDKLLHKALEFGADGFVRKPVNDQKLDEKLDEIGLAS